MPRVLLGVLMLALAVLTAGCVAGGAGTTLFDGSATFNFGQQN